MHLGCINTFKQVWLFDLQNVIWALFNVKMCVKKKRETGGKDMAVSQWQDHIAIVIQCLSVLRPLSVFHRTEHISEAYLFHFIVSVWTPRCNMSLGNWIVSAITQWNQLPSSPWVLRVSCIKWCSEWKTSLESCLCLPDDENTCRSKHGPPSLFCWIRVVTSVFDLKRCVIFY